MSAVIIKVGGEAIHTHAKKDGSGSFISLRVKPKEAPAAPARQQAGGPNDADDFPF